MTDEIHTSSPSPATEDWAGEMGRKWLKNLTCFEDMIQPIGVALLARAQYQPDQTVLDIGFGGGATSLAIAAAVAPSGKVIGVDISPDLTEAAKMRAKMAGMKNLEFVCADAASVQLKDAPYDRLHSRFGSMFFDEPIAAFSNLHSLLRQDGRIDLAVWGPPRDNLWMVEMMGIVKAHIDVPPAIPRTPGPFAFEDLEYLSEVLTDAGFANFEAETYEGLQAVGGPGATPQDALNFALGSMAAGRLLKEAGEDVLRQASNDLLSLYEKHHVDGAGVMMKAKAWLISASA